MGGVSTTISELRNLQATVSKIEANQEMSSIISEPGNERQWARPMSQSFAFYVSFIYQCRSRKMIAKSAFRIKNGVILLKLRGYLLIKFVANANTQAITWGFCMPFGQISP